jgi:hypothetical protein
LEYQKENMIDQNFCDALEYKLCELLSNSSSDDVRGFWCDGVLKSEQEHCYEASRINHTKKIELKAFVGNDGQDEYELALHCGKNSLRKILRNQVFFDTFPTDDADSKFIVDIDLQRIEIHLD